MSADASSIDPGPIRGHKGKSRLAKYGLRGVALGYLFALLLIPVILIFFKAFEDGIAHAWESVTTPEALHAFWLTIMIAGIAVPLNTVFGIAAAWSIAKFDFPGKTFLVTLIDLPFSVSPVVSGLIYVLVFGAQGWFGASLADNNIHILFALPGIVLATIFVTFPFVARELIPLMVDQGRDEEEAAATLGATGFQTFLRITLPNIKWGLLYGILLCNARALGEFGAVSVVSGHIRGLTTTMPLQAQVLYDEYDLVGAFAVASLLMLLALLTLIVKASVEAFGSRRRRAV